MTCFYSKTTIMAKRAICCFFKQMRVMSITTTTTTTTTTSTTTTTTIKDYPPIPVQFPAFPVCGLLEEGDTALGNTELSIDIQPPTTRTEHRGKVGLAYYGCHITLIELLTILLPFLRLKRGRRRRWRRRRRREE